MKALKFRPLDAWRCLDIRDGIANDGYHNFLMDEIEVGPRAAMAFDEDDQELWILHAEEIRDALAR